MNGFFLAGEGRVLPEWIDRNQHMNMARYLALFDAACDALLARCGLVSVGSDLTFVAGRVQMAHRREVFEGDEWLIWSGFAAVAEDRLTFVHRLMSGNTIRATCDIYSTPFSMMTRDSRRLDSEQAQRARAFVVAGLRDPFSMPINATRRNNS